MKADFEKMHPGVKVAIVVLPTIIIAALFFFLIYKPKTQQIKRYEKIINKQKKDIAKAERQLARLPELRKEYQMLKKGVELLKVFLPEEKEISNLLKQVSDLGTDTGLKILLWKPQTRRNHSSGIVYEIPVSVKMWGSYHNLGSFYSSLTALDRIVNIKDIKLGNPKPVKKEAIIDISFNAVTYSGIPEK